MIATAIGKPIANAPTIAKVNSPSKLTPGRTSSTDMSCSNAWKVRSRRRDEAGAVLMLVQCV